MAAHQAPPSELYWHEFLREQKRWVCRRRRNSLPAFCVLSGIWVVCLKYRFLGTTHKDPDPIWDKASEGTPNCSCEASFVRMAGHWTLVDWEIFAASCPGIRNRSEEQRNHWISLIVLWVALCRSFSEMEGGPPLGSWKLIPRSWPPNGASAVVSGLPKPRIYMRRYLASVRFSSIFLCSYWLQERPMFQR